MMYPVIISDNRIRIIILYDGRRRMELGALVY